MDYLPSLILLTAPILLSAPSTAQIAYGSGCAGQSGIEPSISLRSGVVQDETILADFSGAPSTAGFLLAGTGMTQWAGAPLPFDLGNLLPAFAGCQLLQDAQAILPLNLDGNGEGNLSFKGWQPGIAVHFQFWNLDFDPAGLTNLGGFSSGLTYTSRPASDTRFGGTVYATGNTPVAVAAGDFNGDGITDILAATGGAKLHLLLGRGAGVFESAQVQSLGSISDVGALRSVDFDSDGDDDYFVLSDSGSPILWRFANDGQGSFTFDLVQVSGVGNLQMASADYDGDGTRDVALAVGPSISYGSTGSPLSAPTLLADPGVSLRNVTNGDWNADGRTDLAFASANQGFFIYTALPGGGFSTPTSFGAGDSIESLASGDFNNDGFQDLVIVRDDVSGSFTGSLEVWRGDGGNTFVLSTSVEIASESSDLAAADLDFDGNMDVVVGALSPFYGLGTGAFEALGTSLVPFSPSSILVDIDEDGFRDLVAATSFPGNGVIIVRNNGLREMETQEPWPNSGATELAVADFNLDGTPDIAEARFSASEVGIRLGLPKGGFESVTTYPIPFQRPESIAAGDLNGDGRPDIVVGCQHGAKNLWVLLAGPDGVLDAPTEYQIPANPSSASETLQSVAIGDFDNNGTLDVATTREDQVWILLGNGNGTLDSPTLLSLGDASPYDMESADFNEDGLADLVVTSYFPKRVHVLLAAGSGTFEPSIALDPNSPDAPLDVSIGDLNQDGHLDLALWAGSIPLTNRASYRLFYGIGDGTFLSPVDPAPGSTGNGGTPHIADLDGDGVPDLIAGHRFLHGLGGGALSWPLPQPIESSFHFTTDSVLLDVDKDGKLDLVSDRGILINQYQK